MLDGTTRVAGVQTEQGDIAADVVVLCAGMLTTPCCCRNSPSGGDILRKSWMHATEAMFQIDLFGWQGNGRDTSVSWQESECRCIRRSTTTCTPRCLPACNSSSRLPAPACSADYIHLARRSQAAIRASR